MKIPFIDMTRINKPFDKDVFKAVERVIKKGAFILGEEVESFENDFSSYCGKKFGVGVSSGTDALFLALKALGVGEGDEVLTAANTYIATFNAIAMCGATPVPVDPRTDDYCIDPEHVEKSITPKTKAIIPVHLYGQMAEMDSLCQISRERGIPLVEDASQAHGARYMTQPSGSFGTAGCFSFYPTKNLGAFGDGGMVVTDSEEIAENLRLLRDHGQKKKDHHLTVGYNKRLDEIQAAILRSKLSRLDETNGIRFEIARRYIENLREVEEILLPAYRNEPSSHIFHVFVIRTPKRDLLRDCLSREGISTRVHYPVPPHLQPAYRHLGYRRGDFPVAERLAGEVVSLPMFPGLTFEEIDYVSERIFECLHRARKGTGSSAK